MVTYAVIIEAANDDRMLLPGMTAEAKIESASVERALRLPNDALRFKPRGAAALASRAHQALQRLERELERARRKVALTDEQAARVLSIMRAHRPSLGWAGRRSRGGARRQARGGRPRASRTGASCSAWRRPSPASSARRSGPHLEAWRAGRESAYAEEAGAA